jgi:stage V sporulation protein B
LKKTSFIYGSIVLAVVNFIVRVIGFIYKIILSKLIGPEGIGLFQMVFPVLMVFITITTAGIPIAVSKIVSKQKSLNNYSGMQHTMKITFLITLSISVLLSLILVFFGEFISYKMLKNQILLYHVIFLVPAVIIVSLSSLMRGYFYGLKMISPAGISQIIEQLSRIGFVIGVIYILYPVEPELGALIGVCGISIGELLGLVWLVYQYSLLKRKSPRPTVRKNSSLKILNQLFYIAAPITISRLVNVCLQLINAVLIPQRLMVAGYSSTSAVSTFGRVIGMSMPLIFLPFIVTSALVINIIPNISEQTALKKYKEIRKNIELSIRITLLIAIPLSGFYIFFSNPIAMFIYQDNIVGNYIGVLGYSTIFLSLQHVLSGVLHGLGKQVRATVNYIVGMSVQLIATYFLVSKPNIGINGFFIGFISATIIISILHFFSINKVIRINIDLNSYVLKPIISTAIMLTSIFILYNQLSFILGSEFIILLVSLSTGGVLYILGLLFTNCLPKNLISKIFRF